MYKKINSTTQSQTQEMKQEIPSENKSRTSFISCLNTKLNLI